MAKPLVIIFARAPKYGAVKTRLARDIGAAEALRFYRGTLTRLVLRLRRDERFEIVLAVTPDLSLRERGLWPAGVQMMAQGPGDLGRRMIRALRSAGQRRAVVIGSDIPAIVPSNLSRAFGTLGRAPAVLGPARDGGYWLIGSRHPLSLRENVLDGVRWSCADTLGDTVARIPDARALDVVLDDIDTVSQYRAWLKSGSFR